MKKINNQWYTDKQYIELLEKRINKVIETLKNTSVDMPETLLIETILIETIDYAIHQLEGKENEIIK